MSASSSAWQRAEDPATGKPYWYHVETRAVSWKTPNVQLVAKRKEEKVGLLDVEKGDSAPPPKKERFWVEHAEQMKELAPFLWPKNEPWLRASMLAAFACLLLAKVWSVLVPLMLKSAVDSVARGETPTKAVLLYGVFRFLSDATKEARDSLFASSSAYASRKISLRVFNHVQQLSLRFHLNRKTGAVLRAVNRGSASFADLLRYLAFQLAPIFLEVGVVSTYLFINYDPAFGLITIAVMTSYVALTIVVTEWRNKYRRAQTEAEDAFSQQAVDSLLNFETVLLFNAENHVSGIYDKSLRIVADASLESQYSLSLLNIAQNAVISVGVAWVLYLAAQRVVKGTMSVGDFILVQAFILQLYAPLGFLGTYWRMIKAALVDVEAMFKLMKETRETDAPNASDLVVSKANATVQFDNIVFTFEPSRGPLLKGINLLAVTGQKLAIVGSSGAGKSTLARLLFRLYHPDSGRVLIAGTDIAGCTLRSVRQAVSIVPQDTVLFNDTLEYNISLGKLARGELASEAEVLSAVEAAQLSQFLEKQPKRLATLVGERGLRLSGGEKQRVAIARALLKNSAIMVGDEATSALDSHTEQEIMAAMDRAAVGRTYIVIAHRLSTIADANAICVLHEGLVAELGSHAELLARVWAKHANEQQSQAA